MAHMYVDISDGNKQQIYEHRSFSELFISVLTITLSISFLSGFGAASLSFALKILLYSGYLETFKNCLNSSKQITFSVMKQRK